MRDSAPKKVPSIVMLTADRQIDRRILREADSLEAAGWQVTIVGMPLDVDQADTDPRVVRIGSDIKHLPRQNLVLDVYRLLRRRLAMNGRLMRWLKAMAWRYVVDQEEFYVSLYRNAIARFQPDVWVAHDLPMLPVAHAAAKQAGARLVYDSHELYSEQEFAEAEKRRWQSIEAAHIGACDLVLTVNPSIAAELQRRYGIGGVNTIYSAESASRAPSRTRRLHEAVGLAPHRKVLLMQGGMSAGRNLEVLVKAMRHVRDTDIALVFLGDGILRDRLSQQARDLGLTGRVFHLAAVPQDELLAWTESADAGIIPYQPTCLNNYYCTPNKLFEFIAAEVPILGSNLPEISRLVKENDIGLVGDLSSPESTARVIDDFFADAKRLAHWRERLNLVRNTLNWEREGEKLVSAFEPLRA